MKEDVENNVEDEKHALQTKDEDTWHNRWRNTRPELVDQV